MEQLLALILFIADEVGLFLLLKFDCGWGFGIE